MNIWPDSWRRAVVAAVVVALLALNAGACALASDPASTESAATRPLKPAPKFELHRAEQPTVVLLHLPGISGFRPIDQTLVDGLVESLGPGRVVARVYDWPAYDYGMGALMALRRNLMEADFASDWIAESAREFPGVPIVLTSHSGGAGIAAWALQRLPDGVTVREWVQLAPALSPGFDLSPSLKRVSGQTWVLTSPMDPVLKMTRVFGTIDRERVPSSGLTGYERPDGVPAEEYGRLVVVPYQSAWARYGHRGDHVGMMEKAFAREVLGPMLRPALEGAGDTSAERK